MKAPAGVFAIGGVNLFLLAGWAVGGYRAAVGGLVLGLSLLVIPWRGQPLSAWTAMYFSRHRVFPLTEPTTATNDRYSGGVRYQDGIAIVAVQLLGKAHRPTIITGASSVRSDDEFDIRTLIPQMHQSLGLTINSLSTVSAGSRRHPTGDYARVYDTLIGPAPYAGQRDTWLVLRVDAIANADALRYRKSIGAAALAGAQRLAAALRAEGIRARVATSADMSELDKRLGASALGVHNRRWKALRGQSGWLTTYAYHPHDIKPEVLAEAWCFRADAVMQNVTLFPDGSVSATVTVQTPQPPTASPSSRLVSLPGEQAGALVNCLCAPRIDLRGQTRGRLSSLTMPVGPSGVLVGTTRTGDRLLIPLADRGEQSRIEIYGDDTLTKRIIIRTAATGERITIHTDDLRRWDSVRMPNVIVTDQSLPAPGSTVSVVDGSVSPSPQPQTLIIVQPAAATPRRSVDVVIKQIGPTLVDIVTENDIKGADVELFRAENRYISELAMVD